MIRKILEATAQWRRRGLLIAWLLVLLLLGSCGLPGTHQPAGIVRMGDHTATLLPTGRILVAGGNTHGALASAEIFDPANGQWQATAAMSTARAEHTATLLNTGQVLVTGGLQEQNALATAERYDPATGHWTAAGTMAVCSSSVGTVEGWR
jgi:hypothetical protein